MKVTFEVTLSFTLDKDSEHLQQGMDFYEAVDMVEEQLTDEPFTVMEENDIDPSISVDYKIIDDSRNT